LVEDEVLIRMMLADDLRDVGHHVIEACDADEAIALLPHITPDLIITDVRMPGSMDGLGLLAHVRSTSPDLPVIVTSAHLDPTCVPPRGPTLFVAKPYLSRTLLTATERLLPGPCDDVAA
jgi:CheY-like chemotaxis protein